MKALTTLWRFGRPHTLIGSTLSLVSIYAIAAAGPLWQLHLGSLAISLLSALACNIYITGLNQWSDVEVDRINKPWLPIPAGELSRAQALRIVLVCGLLALASAASFSAGFFLLILGIMGLGTAYSLPPLKFKRSHVLAAGAITLVRGLLVNLGFYLHFRHEMGLGAVLTPVIWPLTVFVAAFSLGIAWFKDIPDTAGDAEYRFGTLAVRSGRRMAFLAGVAVVSAAYLFVMAAAAFGQLPAPAFYLGSHAVLLGAFLWQARSLAIEDDQQVKRFYMFFWGLFFAEYVLYPIGLFC